MIEAMNEIPMIVSRDNGRLVHARKVRDGKVRSQMFIEGRRLVNEALSSDLVIDECFVSVDFRDAEMLDDVSKRTEAIAQISGRLFRSVADTDHSQGIILIAKRPTALAEQIESRLGGSSLPIVVFLKEINNPSNLGAVLRTAEAAGVAGVIVSANSSDVYSPKALRAAMGASFRLPIWTDADLGEVLHWARAKNLRTTATSSSTVISYTGLDWKIPRLLIFGSEAHGLNDSEMASTDEKVRIPMESGVESLNLAVSTGIILFEAKRQSKIETAVSISCNE